MGEYFSPLKMDMTEEQIAETYYGIVDPNLPFSNAHKTMFNIKSLLNLVGFFDCYCPKVSLSLDACNLSSITTVTQLAAYYSASSNAIITPVCPLATGVKFYPFLLGHGYDQALVEFTICMWVNISIGFEESRFWLPPSYNLANTKPQYLTSHKQKIVKITTGAGDATQDITDCAAIARVVAMLPSTADECGTFNRALQLSPVVLAIGGVLADSPKLNSMKATKGIHDQFTVSDLQLAFTYQESNSVFITTNLELNNPINLWCTQLLFGCTVEASPLETELCHSHRVPLFKDIEQQYIQHNTLKLFQWVMTFLPHIHSQSTIQFEAKPSLMEILEEMCAVTLLCNKARNLMLDPSYLELNSFEKSSISNHLTLMDSAMAYNVKELIHLVGKGQVCIETYSSSGGNYDNVQKACHTMQYSAFDCCSDFTLESPPSNTIDLDEIGDSADLTHLVAWHSACLPHPASLG
ncbi:hypothetical protein J3R82DRAFT_11616 [Butyriboletus roseoflavus]|nr:hypothetical protein J3R82DRAFT_11616 [Butyriboletus roseoflavus]